MRLTATKLSLGYRDVYSMCGWRANECSGCAQMVIDPAEIASAIDAAVCVPPVESSGMRRTAVLVPLVQRAEPRLLLIRRADRGDPWANHIAFPGGHVDETDAGDLEAALRELGSF